MTAKAEKYEDIGKTLREARLAMGVDLLDAAQQLHIRAKYLTALEEGHLDELPGNAYIRGYLQNYSEYLGFDKQDVLEAYERVTSKKAEPEFYIPEPTRKENAPTPLVMAIGCAIIIACILLWAAFMHEEPMSVTQVSEVPESFSTVVSERFRMTNALYACLEAEGKTQWPFCAPSAIIWPEETSFHSPVFSVVENDE